MGLAGIMHFSDLYKSAENIEEPFIRFGFLRDQINGLHQEIGRVDIQRVTYPEPMRSAYWRLADSDRSSAYEEPFSVAEIVYCSTLDLELDERRYALTKELMHAFDTPEQQANSRERFIQLMRDVQNRPLLQHASPMYQSEIHTRWMAAIILCPKPKRDRLKQSYEAKDLLLSEIASSLRLPEWVASFVLDDYYNTAFATIVEGQNGF
jgi:hypothetical protein